MKPQALATSIAVLLLIIAAVLFRPDNRKINSNAVSPQEQAGAQVAPARTKTVSSRTLDDRITDRQNEEAAADFFVRSRERAKIGEAGQIVAFAEAHELPSKISLAEAVIDLMQDREAAKGYEPDDFSDVVVTSKTTSKHNGVTHLYLRQRIHGIEVYNGDTNANIAQDGTVLSLHNRFVKSLRSDINTTEPSILPEKAVRLAAVDLGVGGANEASLVVAKKAKGEARETEFHSTKLSQDPIPVKLMYYPLEESTRLVWNLVMHIPSSTQWMDVNVDAESGEVLSKANWYASADYKVFPLPFETPLDGSRQTEADPHDTTASPFGWHDTDGVAGAEFTDTRGNNVNAQDDIDANNSGGDRPDGGGALSFDNPLDLAQDPASYRDGAITNLFYWNNILHDIFYQYGFDESSGNFQENNYGNGGAGSDPVEADAQDGSGTNNANFGTPPDGFNPRMQMFVWTDPNPDRDSDLDNVIIVHEYGHGVSNRLTGGAANSSALTANQSRGMGEGWSDWWGLVLTAKDGQLSTLSRSVGYYVLGQNTSGAGIRPRPYTTDLNANEYTYGDIQSGLSVPHGIGFVWCSILWEMYWSLVDQHGFDPDFYGGTGGNNVALQLVMDGLKLQPATPTYLEARDAILLADQVNYGGANKDLIWQAFAKRGMGFSASDAGDPNDLNVSEAFDLPDEQFSIDDVIVTETDSGTVEATFTITLNPAAVEITTVNYATVDGSATAPSDFTAAAGSLSFAVGESSKTITIAVVGEDENEGDETFSVQLSNPVNGVILDGEGICTILTDDYLSPVITSSLSADAFLGNSFSYQITADNSPRSFALVNPPAGMVIDSDSGVISWEPTITGTVSVQISAINPGGVDTQTLVIEVRNDPVQLSLNTDLAVSKGGDKSWFRQVLESQDGVDAAQSGAVSHNEESWIEVSVTGPDTLRFWWKVSSESNYDFLRLSSNGTRISALDGEEDWQPYVYSVPSGTHTIRWSYEKDGSVSTGSDAGWVDMISLDSEDPRPVIVSLSSLTGLLNQPFSHQIQTTHTADSFSVVGTLPSGLSLDSATGIVSGTPTTPQTSQVTISATNSDGTAEQILTIEVQDPIGMGNALDTGLSIRTGAIPWFNQTTTTYDGVDAAQSGAVADGESTWFELDVVGPDTLSFYWKVSSESGIDLLRLLDNGQEVTSVSGEQDWREIVYNIPAGNHTIRWVYEKDPVISNGADSAWVDEIVLASASQLSEAIDASGTSPATGGSTAWFLQSDTTYDGADAAQSGGITHDQVSWMEVIVEGPETIQFHWKVSSEDGYDHLRFIANGATVSSISGEADWELLSHNLPAGVHTLRWEYEKDGSVSSGSDAGWVDELILSSSDLRPIITSSNIINGEVGQSLEHQITTTQPAVSYSVSSLPAGLTLDSSTGLISGTPVVGADSVVEVTATNASGSYTQVITVRVNDLPGALDVPFAITSGGDGDHSWFFQSSITHDELDAAQSGEIDHNESSWFEFSVEGPKTVSFWWKVSSESNYDYLRFLQDSVQVTSISGEQDWVRFTHDVPSGTHVLRWAYDKDSSASSGSDSGWVDEIVVMSPQEIDFPEIPNMSIFSSYLLSATGGGSGNPVTFEVVSGPAVLSNDNVLTFSGTGLVTVRASQAGGASHNAAPDVSRTFSIYSQREMYDLAVGSAGFQGDAALPEASPLNDGTTNLERYAFNMALDSPSFWTMSEGGDSGFPRLFIDWSLGQPLWKLQHVRRINGGIIYTPVSSSEPNGVYSEVSDPAIQVTPINSEWEMVEIAAPATEDKLFIKVELSFPGYYPLVTLGMENNSVSYSNNFENGMSSLDGFSIGEVGDGTLTVESGRLKLSPGSGYLNRSYASFKPADFLPGFDPVLDSNTGLLTWAFNVSNEDGVSLNNMFAFEIGSESDPSDGSIFSYDFSGGGFVGDRMLVRNSAHANSPMGPESMVLVDEANGLEPGNEGAFRITFDPGNGRWDVYFEQSATPVDPLMVDSLLGSFTNTAYTGLELAWIIFNSQTNGHVYFDNFTFSIEGDASTRAPYSEHGFTIRDPDAGEGIFNIIESGSSSGRADNGGRYFSLSIQVNSSFELAPSDGGSFDVVSVDLAEYSTVFQEARTVEWVGYKANGTTVTTSFTIDGTIDGPGGLADFETFTFPASFQEIVRLESSSTLYSIDNIVVRKR